MDGNNDEVLLVLHPRSWNRKRLVVSSRGKASSINKDQNRQWFNRLGSRTIDVEFQAILAHRSVAVHTRFVQVEDRSVFGTSLIDLGKTFQKKKDISARRPKTGWNRRQSTSTHSPWLPACSKTIVRGGQANDPRSPGANLSRRRAGPRLLPMPSYRMLGKEISVQS